ncbi:unnamed protein product [Brachionus calyciflorus]|uniref:Uncharacterized protein n=1 Tax=Brachionus calyciflorus TaxID=104777 RepID=A0A814IDL4_9BILA|nr:unnamed protein product [Brachionus calyciflorus]
MGNCCCVLKNGDKRKFKSSQSTKPGNLKRKQQYYKYGDDEYDNDDFDDDDLDYDRQTTKSDLSSSCNNNKSINQIKKPRQNRLIDKAILNQHLKQQQQLNQNNLESSSSSSTILLLKQSHLVQPSSSNLEKNFNSELKCKISEFDHNKQNNTILLLNHTESYNLALNKIKKSTSSSLGCNSGSSKTSKRWSIISSDLIDSLSNLNKNGNNNNNNLVNIEENLNNENSDENLKPLLSEFYNSDDVDDGVDVGDDDDNFDDSTSSKIIINNQHRDHLTDNNSSSDHLILNSISSTVITTSKSSYNNNNNNNETTPKLIQSCHSMKSTSIDDLTSNSQDDFECKTRRLVYQKKQNSNLNHSLNETDLVINCKSKINKKRKLKQRKIDLNNDVNQSYIQHGDDYDEEDEEFTSDLENKLRKNYVNYRSLQKSKRSIKSLEQTLKNSKSIEKWLNDFDKIKELDQPSIPESPQSTIQRSDLDPNHELYSLLDSKTQTIPKKILDSIPKNLLDLIQDLINLNSNLKTHELDMYSYFKKLCLPKSLANAEDINYLKQILNENNFNLFIEQPCMNKLNLNYILKCKNININLVDCDHHHDGVNESSMEDQCYVKYFSKNKTLLLDQEKIKYILKKEKELCQGTNLSNQGVLESFREKYIETNNFNSVQILWNICKKTNYLKKSNLSSNSSSSSSTTTTTTSTPILNTSTTTDCSNLPIQFSDLNDKLFLCLLSNFSCKLVDNFLHSTNNNLNLFNKTGFIRKHKMDKSFSYITQMENTEFKTINFKMCLKLSKWPGDYDFKERLNFIKSQSLVDYIENETCLITNLDQRDDFETSLEHDEFGYSNWSIDTRLAETVIFKSLDKLQTYGFFYLVNILNNLKLILDGSKSLIKLNELNNINYRILLHHYLRFIGSNRIDIEFDKLFIQFSLFLRSSIEQYNSLNVPNFFNFKLDIIQDLNDCRLDELVDLLKKTEVYFNKSSKHIDLSLQFRPLFSNDSNNNRLFNEYLNDFFQILFEQFKAKRDHFKMNEQVLIDIHEKVVQSNENLNMILMNDIDISAALLSKFEMYAECVHKYLPQIRQYNQYLLFHYIWTMQVQYLAPFFNYICDMYKSYN